MIYLLPLLMLTHGIQGGAPTDASLVFGPPVQAAEWRIEPTVIICQGAPVKLARVEQAVDFWRKLGYNIGEVIVSDEHDFSCMREIILVGEILITLVSQDFHMSEHLAVTRTWIHKDTNQILKAKIEIMSGWGDSERIMEHELGHAMGWRDYNQTGHLMHSEWARGGHNTKGLKK
jgi:hypothetical protein